MFWETLWALILGFGLSGAVQAFVTRADMEKTLGDHRPRAVARASVLGMVSSSCSYAASAMAKSLFQKGADFVAAIVFMFASTNLVIELGLVLVALMGWEFAAAEFVGGPIMIVLLALTGGFVFRQATVARARRRLVDDAAARHEHATGSTPAEEVQHLPWRRKLRSVAGWSDAAAYTMSDLSMLRRELVIGYGIAGFLAILVPVDTWNTVFVTGHGSWTSVENAVVAPLIACIAFVCSIGNVPMAAALWHGGISFGGVISFVFADLVAFPLLLVYRKYYGTRMALRLFVWFYAVMATAGLAVEGIFSGLGLVPSDRPKTIVMTHFSWNYTTFLNIAFLAVFGLLYWLFRNRERLGGCTGHATDPVCGMQVEKAGAPARATIDGVTYWFCSDSCRTRFEADHAHTSTTSG